MVIVQAFFRWTATARASERAKAAGALGRAYLSATLGREEQRAAALAMTYLLDDPSPHVRLALAEALAGSPEAPRAIILALAEDQPEISCTVIACSPVITEADLIDLAGRGDGLIRGFIAARPQLSRGAAAAIVEIGEENDVTILLENESAAIGRQSLRRIAERFGHSADIRSLLLDREYLPADARHLLVHHVTTALTGSDLVRATMAAARIEHVSREAGNAAAVVIAGGVPHEEIPDFVEHLRGAGLLTPAFLIHALCAGKVDFFAGAVANLSGLEDRRVRAILATGRMHAVRALLESAGLDRDIALVFVEAILLRRRGEVAETPGSISALLLERFQRPGMPASPVSELLDMVEKLQRAEMRSTARSYADDACLAA
ncbi:DUF2336 domain-containing protein [Rhizobium sp. LC145]|uniref:DUF2336 domain-containing protein n=1 Tax=Rhizobium sp. LC145 TaxID=1120688 RepID=UPI00062A3A9F|nr:DUF2336 domain-containing protein [Rhizobium sp. LC145]KKX33755.1 hypothetical protein YH62_00760 [Rhizobium sp. LC145]